MSTIEIKKNKIIDVDADAIVCPANNYLLAAGGVNREIFNAAGRDELLAICKEFRYCETGNAVITPGLELKQKFIVHAVGPIWTDGEHGEPGQLKGAYDNSFRLAKENGCKSIVCPLISTGIFGYPTEYAWEIAITSAIEFLKGCDEDFDVYFAIYDDNYIAAGQREFVKREEQLKKEGLDEKIKFLGIDEMKAEGDDGKFVFFWNDQEENGYLSKWYKHPFDVDGVKYSCVEQYLMAKKALAMDDIKYYIIIMHEENQQEMRNLGRKIENFDPGKWLKNLPKILYDANFAKFSQNKELERKLLLTEDKTLVCADPENRLYGVGWASFEPEIRDVDLWCGKNLLGEAIMKVREDLKNS